MAFAIKMCQSYICGSNTIVQFLLEQHKSRFVGEYYISCFYLLPAFNSMPFSVLLFFFLNSILQCISPSWGRPLLKNLREVTLVTAREFENYFFSCLIHIYSTAGGLVKSQFLNACSSLSFLQQ